MQAMILGRKAVKLLPGSQPHSSESRQTFSQPPLVNCPGFEVRKVSLLH